MKVLVSNPGTGVFIVETVNAYRESNSLYSYYTTFVSNNDIPFFVQTFMYKEGITTV